MTTDEFTPPRKKPNVFWWIGGLILLLLIIFVFQLFGPNPPIIISPQTTFITEPLAKDGLPDYEKYVLELYREGVTPENNAAALIWPALWPGELNPSQYAMVARELGLDSIPNAKDALKHLHGDENRARVAKWLASEQKDASQPDGTPPKTTDDSLQEGVPFEATPEGVADELLDRVMTRPWTSAQVPPIAKWVAENQKPLNMLVAGSQRPRCYIPSPSLLDASSDSIVSMLLPGVQSFRVAARALSARAMWHLGEGRLDAAWQDTLAIHRIGQLVTQGYTLIELLVGFSLQSIACESTITLLHHGQLTGDQARQILRDLKALPHNNGVSRSLGLMERTLYLDVIVRQQHEFIDDMPVDLFEFTDHVSIDWNVSLRKGNQFYDRLAAAAALPTYQARRLALSNVEGDIDAMSPKLGVGLVASALLSPYSRSDVVASALLTQFLPALSACDAAQDRTNTTLDLTRLAAALAVYRAENGAYPQKLTDLVPTVLDQQPFDLFSASPFVYRTIGEGYLLYSMGPNAKDDGGSNETYSLFQGQVQSDTNAPPPGQQIPSDADDISIRVPGPAFELPKAAEPTLE